LQSGNSEGTEARLADALRGAPPPLTAFAAKSPQEALAAVGSDFQTKELRFTSFAGEPAYIAIAAPGRTRIVPMRGAPASEFDHDKIVELVRQAAKPASVVSARVVSQYESYYRDRHNELPLPVIFVQLDDKENSSYYIDPRTARILESYNSNSRWNRWLYHGLHSMDLPWLYKHRPAWDIVVLTLLLGGISLCVTSLLLAWQVLRRKLFSPRAPRNAGAAENT
jgi:PepSY-associated transmembrane protein